MQSRRQTAGAQLESDIAGFSEVSGLLGLKDAAEALGGNLRLHSPPGIGATLEIELPVELGGPKSPGELGW